MLNTVDRRNPANQLRLVFYHISSGAGVLLSTVKGHSMTPTQIVCMIIGEVLLNYHTFVLFDSPESRL